HSQVGGRENWVGEARRSVADALAARAYNYLMSESASFATLPRPSVPDRNVPLSTFAHDPAFQALVTESEKLLAVAQKAAQGHWPVEASTEWELPTSRAFAIAGTIIGIALAGTGL